MASLAQAIRTFHRGALSPVEFFAQIEQVLASDQGNSGKLLAILDEEHTNFPLPPEVYTEVHRRIEKRDEKHEQAKKTDGTNGEVTRVLTNVNASHPAHPPHTSPAGQARAAAPADTEPERIKSVGDTLNGRFVLEECLGFGGMGMVFRALDLRKLEASDRNPYIAIKVLNVQFRGHPKSLIALQREAKKAQRLAHPNIVTVYDFDRDGSTVYLTMELLAGKPLRQLLRTPDFKGLPYARALPIITSIARALAYAHERGFVHCDLKPANVFLTDSGEVKVIDFGIARAFRKPDDESEATVFDPGTLGGMTPTYASAEMLERLDPDPRDDIYALGCISYEILTGRHPFDRMPATQARAANCKPLRPKDLGMRQWQALRKALAFNRDKRTANVSEFLEGIGQRPAMKYAAVAGVAGVIGAMLSVAALVVSWQDMHVESPEDAVLSAAPPAAIPAPSAAPSPAPSPAPSGAPSVAPPLAPSVTPPPAEPERPAAMTPQAAAAIVAGLPCSALAAVGQDGGVLVQGFLHGRVGSARLRDMLGGAANLKLDVRPVADEDCAVIDAFAPYWRANREAGRAASIRTKAANGELREGDSLIVDITTPAYDAYVHIDYFVLGGGVLHLVPSPRAKANQTPPNYAATVGSLGNWVVSKPFGSELVVLVTSPVPVFDGLRPEYEDRADYLRALAARLKEIAAKNGGRIAADFVQVTTRPRS